MSKFARVKVLWCVKFPDKKCVITLEWPLTAVNAALLIIVLLTLVDERKCTGENRSIRAHTFGHFYCRSLHYNT